MWLVGGGFAGGTATNKHGIYRLEFGGGVTSGKFPIQFDSSCDTANPFGPIAPGPWAPEWYKGKFSAAKANKVLVKAGKTTRGINAVMRPGGEVSGTISGSDHRRLKNACAVRHRFRRVRARTGDHQCQGPLHGHRAGSRQLPGHRRACLHGRRQ